MLGGHASLEEEGIVVARDARRIGLRTGNVALLGGAAEALREAVRAYVGSRPVRFTRALSRTLAHVRRIQRAWRAHRWRRDDFLERCVNRWAGVGDVLPAAQLTAKWRRSSRFAKTLEASGIATTGRDFVAGLFEESGERLADRCAMMEVVHQAYTEARTEYRCALRWHRAQGDGRRLPSFWATTAAPAPSDLITLSSPDPAALTLRFGWAIDEAKGRYAGLRAFDRERLLRRSIHSTPHTPPPEPAKEPAKEPANEPVKEGLRTESPGPFSAAPDLPLLEADDAAMAAAAAALGDAAGRCAAFIHRASTRAVSLGRPLQPHVVYSALPPVGPRREERLPWTMDPLRYFAARVARDDDARCRARSASLGTPPRTPPRRRSLQDPRSRRPSLRPSAPPSPPRQPSPERDLAHDPPGPSPGAPQEPPATQQPTSPNPGEGIVPPRTHPDPPPLMEPETPRETPPRRRTRSPQRAHTRPTSSLNIARRALSVTTTPAAPETRRLEDRAVAQERKSIIAHRRAVVRRTVEAALDAAPQQLVLPPTPVRSPPRTPPRTPSREKGRGTPPRPGRPPALRPGSGPMSPNAASPMGGSPLAAPSPLNPGALPSHHSLLDMLGGSPGGRPARLSSAPRALRRPPTPARLLTRQAVFKPSEGSPQLPRLPAPVQQKAPHQPKPLRFFGPRGAATPSPDPPAHVWGGRGSSGVVAVLPAATVMQRQCQPVPLGRRTQPWQMHAARARATTPDLSTHMALTEKAAGAVLRSVAGRVRLPTATEVAEHVTSQWAVYQQDEQGEAEEE